MIKHSFFFLGRLISRDKVYYSVSLLGLSVSLASLLLILLFVNDELSYDKFHSNAGRIFRVTTHIRLNDVNYDEASSQFPAAAALKSEFGEVRDAVRLYPQDLTMQVAELKFQEHVLYADDNFFSVFSFKLLNGDKRTPLSDPGQIVLTESTAQKYFGANNPIGQQIFLDNKTLIVSAVMQDVPDQSHVHFDAVVPLQLQLDEWKSRTGTEGRENKWFWTGAYTYLLLKDGAEVRHIEASMPSFVDKYFPERFRSGGRFELQALPMIHLYSHLDAELEPGGTILYIKLFAIVAAVIVVVCAINLVNLAWFKVGDRIRELGIRKFLGQSSGRIVAQLVFETTLVGAAAFCGAILLCILTLGPFNLMIHKNLSLVTIDNSIIIGAAFILVIAICTLAVLRPAWQYVRRSSGSLLLYHENSRSRGRLRNILIGVQVCFSFVMLVFSFVVSRQIDLFRNKDLGFNKQNVVVVSLTPAVSAHLEAFKSELKKQNAVISVSGSEVPGAGYNAWRFVPEGGSMEKPVMFPYAFVDHDFLQTLQISLLAGRDFAAEPTGDSLLPYIINKRAAIEMGWTGDPINKTIEIFAPGTAKIMAKGRVIGMIDDFHFESLHKPVKPLILTPARFAVAALIKLDRNADEGLIASLQTTWKKFSDEPFVYELLDKDLEKHYANENQLGWVIGFFTFIALFLTCFGLFAMSSLLFSSRLKEVAIRKVFGANQLSIMRQLYRRYALFNLAAIIVGIPAALYIGNLWLDTFPYRIQLTGDLLGMAGLWVFLAGLLSVSYYLVQVAFSNPVRFLREE